MAYQTLGNRVLGGIGAPGGGMAESFNAGVNTSLGQRTARQNMAAQAQTMATAAQELKWKEEDRKIAAQQRAAAAAARARSEAAMKAVAAGQNLTPKTGVVPPGMNAGPIITPGNVAGLFPANWFGSQTGAPATAPTVYKQPKLSFSLGVPAGATTTTPTSFTTTAQAPVGVRTATAPVVTAKTPVVTAKTPVVTAKTPVVTAAPAALPTFELAFGGELTLNLDGSSSVTYPNGTVRQYSENQTDNLLQDYDTTAEELRASQTPATAPALPTFTPPDGKYTMTVNPDGSSSVAWSDGSVEQLSKTKTKNLLFWDDTSVETVRASQTPATTPAPVVPTTPAPVVPTAPAPATTNFTTTAPAPVGTQPAPAGLPVIKLPGVSGATLQLNPDGSSLMTDAQGLTTLLDKPNTEELLTMAGTTAAAVRAGQAYPPTAGTGQTFAQQISGMTEPVREGAARLADRAAGQITGMATGLYGAQAGLVGLGASAMGFPEFGQASFDVAGNAFSSAARQGNEGLFGSNAPGNFTTNEPAPVGVQPAPVGVQPAPVGVQPTTTTPPPMDFGVGFGAGQTSLSYGPSLGAVDQTTGAAPGLNPTTNTAAERLAANPVDQAAPTPDSMAYVMEPGRPGREMQQALDAYNELARQAKIYSDYGQTADFATTVAKMKEAENTLYHLQGMQALQDLAFNSPQRLEAVLGEQFGRTVAIQPNPNGNWDIYADGKKALELSKDELSNWARGQIDTGFAAAEAERVAKYNEKVFDSALQQDREIAVAAAAVDNTLLLELTKADIDAIKVANNADIEIQKALALAKISKDSVLVVDVTGPDGGVVKVVFDKLTGAPEGYFTLVDPADPSRPLATPLYVPYK